MAKMRMLTSVINNKGSLCAKLFLSTLTIIILIIFISLNSSISHKRRYIFIDGGAHIGETVNSFFKSKLYLKYPWEIFSFEPNPNLAYLIPIKPRMTVLDKAIWISDGEIDFYLSKHGRGSSLIKEKKSGGLSKILVRVESVDFGQWIKNRFSKDDFILVKLDIEGAEYKVLDKMLADGSIEYVDELYIEFHNTKVGISEEKDKELLKKIEERRVRIGAVNKPTGTWFDDK